MILKSLALVLIHTLLHAFLFEGVKAREVTRYDLLKAWTATKQITIQHGKHGAKKLHEIAKRKTFVGNEKEETSRKRKLLGKLKEKQRNENLVEQLAISSEMNFSEGISKKRKTVATRARKTNHTDSDILHAKHGIGVILLNKKVNVDANEKRATIALPSSIHRTRKAHHIVRVTPTLLSALAMLLDERNHFQKDSNALTLARVLLSNDSVLRDAQTALSKLTDRKLPLKKVAMFLGGNSTLQENELHLTNASLTEQLMNGERKSIIHTELINPTELGVSILRLLFGPKAPLVMKPRYEPMVEHDLSRLSNPTASSWSFKADLGNKQFLRGHRKPTRFNFAKKKRQRSFSFALAKAVSEIIKSMAKDELNSYMQKLSRNSGKSKSLSFRKVPSRFWPSRKKVDVQGDRKSWVLLKIPKVGDVNSIHQKALSDKPPEEGEENVLENDDNELDADKEPAEAGGIVDTLGKLNDAEAAKTIDNDLMQEALKSQMKNATQAIVSDSPLQPTPRVGYSVRVLPSLRGKGGQGTDFDRTTIRPTRKTDAPSKNAATFALAVKKLLQAVQSSIKTLQGKHLIGYPEPTHKPVDPVPKVSTDQSTNTGSIRGMELNQVPQNEKQKDPIIGQLEQQTGPSLGELAVITKDTGQSNAPVHQNVLFDPLNDLDSSPSEPITKQATPTRARPGPSENVLFESNMELGSPRDRQESSTIKHLKEDLETFAERGLQAHNRLRKEHHSSTLRWSDELATQAEKLAYDMAMKGVVERSDDAMSKGLGENVAKITGVSFNDAGLVATDVWYSESNNYSYSYPRLTPQTDAFTQLVWKGTKEIGMGCAKDIATNDLYVVALYRPPGNDRRFLRANVVNKGSTTEDVYATIFKRTQL